MHTPPLFIALCGAPKAGKSEVQRILFERYGIRSADDGRVLRDAVKTIYGASEEQVTTQEGKKSSLLVAGKPVEVRLLLGWIGQKLEELHGPDFIPIRACENALEAFGGLEGFRAALGRDNSLPQAFCFGSVRRDQPRVYKAQGGICVEIDREGCIVLNDFDRYNRAFIDFQIKNPLRYDESVTPSADELAAARSELEARVIALFDQFYRPLEAAA